MKFNVQSNVGWVKRQRNPTQSLIIRFNNQDLRKISLKSSFLRDLCAWSGSLFHKSCVSPNNVGFRSSTQPTGNLHLHKYP
jgi:hypothetical protein